MKKPSEPPVKEKPKMMIIRGLMPVIILYVLRREGPSHGYSIKKKVEEINGKPMPQGMIYTTLKRMEKSKLIEHFNEGRKKYYRMTDLGEKFLCYHIEVLKRINKGIIEIIEFMEAGKRGDNSKPKGE